MNTYRMLSMRAKQDEQTLHLGIQLPRYKHRQPKGMEHGRLRFQAILSDDVGGVPYVSLRLWVYGRDHTYTVINQEIARIYPEQMGWSRDDFVPNPVRPAKNPITAMFSPKRARKQRR